MTVSIISPLIKPIIPSLIADINGFSPLVFNPALWLDAQDPDPLNFVFNGDDVSEWRDKSGNGENAVQSTAIEQPEFISNGLNGRPTVRSVHAGAAMGLEIIGGISIGLNDPRTMFMVVNPTAGFGASEVFGKDTGNMIDFGTFKAPADPNFPDRIRFRNSDGGTTESISAQGSVIYGTPHIITITQGTTANSLNAFNESTQILTNVFNTFDWELNVNLGIGKSLNVGSRSYHGDISEIILYPSVLNNTDRLRVFDYLTTRWGF